MEFLKNIMDKASELKDQLNEQTGGLLDKIEDGVEGAMDAATEKIDDLKEMAAQQGGIGAMVADKLGDVGETLNEYKDMAMDKVNEMTGKKA